MTGSFQSDRTCSPRTPKWQGRRGCVHAQTGLTYLTPLKFTFRITLHSFRKTIPPSAEGFLIVVDLLLLMDHFFLKEARDTKSINFAF